MSPAEYIAWKVQQRTIARYRRAWGFERIMQPNERPSAIGAACLIGALVAVWVAAWFAVQ